MTAFVAKKLKDHRLKPGGVQRQVKDDCFVAEKLKDHRLKPGGVEADVYNSTIK